MNAFDQDLRNYVADQVHQLTGKTPTWVRYSGQAEALTIQLDGQDWSAHCEEFDDVWEFQSDSAPGAKIRVPVMPGREARMGAGDSTED